MRYYGKNRCSLEEIVRRKTEGNWQAAKEIVRRDREPQKQEQLAKQTKYNGKYREIVTTELAKYLFQRERKQNTGARFRCGNEKR